MLENYPNNNFFTEYRKYQAFLEKAFILELESTNSKLENYSQHTSYKHAKRINITPEGIYDYIMAREHGRIEKQKKVPTN